MEEVSGLAFIAVVLAGSASIFLSPFYRYIDSVKRHHPSARVEQFVSACGFSTNGKQPIYTLGGHWTISKDLPKDVYDAESDSLTTAEFWKQDGVASVVNLWATDIESEQNTMFCFGPNRAIRFVQSTQWSLPYDGNGKWSYGWIYEQHLAFTSDGKLSRKTGNFMNQKGDVVAAPKMDEEERKDFDFVPDYKKLNFPAQMLP
ncbi:MAG TPA: hypothetical protein VN670_09790 [Acidobacteriaceae bacterium]|nr:hypothetical protein [Acidobacteriaceae bacterium]